MNTEKYFRRLGLPVPDCFEPTGANLVFLHRIHVMNIPYENTDYLTGDIRSADPGIQFHQIVEKQRGGMCLDVNTLFGCFLRELGYKVRMGAARFCKKPDGTLNWHIIFETTDLDGCRWWCDAACPFTTFPEPVRIDTPEIQVDEKPFRCLTGSDGRPEVYEYRNGIWEKQFELLAWDVTTADMDDSKFHSSADFPEDAVFTKEVFSLVTPFGRKTLTGDIFRESFGSTMVKAECGREMKKWAYDQFLLGDRLRL